MKKVLIVDDNENNRMLLRALLEDYAEDNEVELKINEAVNGLEAALIAEEEHCSLIFMDIMMPEMDGIEATKRIRAQDAKSMIVAVSAVDDGERQRQILRNGAEDYISKPINADIFTARLGNYFSLIDSRDTKPKRTYPHAVNLFTKEVYARQFNFYIANDDELSEFWEYYLLDSAERSEELSDAVRTMHALASIGLKVGANLELMVEESENEMYLSLIGIKSVDSKLIKLILIKNPSVTDVMSDQNTFCIRLPRPRISEPVSIVYESPIEQEVAPTITAQDIPTVNYATQNQELYVYNFMETEDMEDLREYVGKLNSLMSIVGGEIENHEVDEIGDNLQHISRISSVYTESFAIGNALGAVARSIIAHRESFVSKASDLAPMRGAFGRDLSVWIQMIFTDGAPDVHYMDDTIIANAQMLENMLSMDDYDHANETEALDDIFDF